MPDNTPRPRCRRNTALPQLLEMCVRNTDDCVEWPYGRDSIGYGVININGTYVRTHVLACTHAHGPNPGDLVVAHGCGNPSCVNARHLRWATPTENAHDKRRHGTHIQGEAHPHHKLTEDEVLDIRAAYTLGASMSGLARHYGVHRITVRSIIRGTNWKHLPV